MTYLSRPPLPTLALLLFGLLPYFVIGHFLCKRLETTIPECRRCRRARLLHPSGLIAILLTVLFFPFWAILLNYHPRAYSFFSWGSAALIVAAAVWWVFCDLRSVRGRLSFDAHDLTLRGVDPAVAAMFDEMRTRPPVPTQTAPTPTPQVMSPASYPPATPASQVVPAGGHGSRSVGQLSAPAQFSPHPAPVPLPAAQFTADAVLATPVPPPVPVAAETPAPDSADLERAARERADRALADRAAAGHSPGTPGGAPGQSGRRELPPLPPLPTIAEVAGGGGGRFGGPPAAASSAQARFGPPPTSSQFGGGPSRFGAPNPLPAPAEGIALPGQTLLPRPKR